MFLALDGATLSINRACVEAATTTTNTPSGPLAASHVKSPCVYVCAHALSVYFYACSHVFVSLCSHVFCHFTPSHLSASARLLFVVVVHTIPTFLLLPVFPLPPSPCLCLIVSPSHFTRQKSPRLLLSICSPPPPLPVCFPPFLIN